MSPFVQAPVQVGQCAYCIHQIDDALDLGFTELELVDGPDLPYDPFSVTGGYVSIWSTSGYGSLVAGASASSVESATLSLTGVTVTRKGTGKDPALYCKSGTVLSYGSAFDGAEKGRALQGDGCDLALDSSTVAGGGIALNRGTLVGTWTSWTSNATVGPGGAIAATLATVTLDGCLFYDNSATGDGGAIDCQDSWLRHAVPNPIANTFGGNHADGDGGAIHATGDSFVTLDGGDVFGGDSATGSGGAVAAGQGASLVVTGASFSGSTAENGGAVATDGASAVVITDATFDDTTAEGDGGALHLVGPTYDLVVRDSTFTGTAAAGSGGAVSATAVDGIVVDGSTFQRTSAGIDGGALRIDQAAEILVDLDTFLTPEASGYGGAVALADVQKASLIRSAFCSPHAGRGGGVSASRGDTTLANDRFAGAEGGVLAVDAGGTLDASQVTIRGSLGDASVGWVEAGSGLTLRSSIVAEAADPLFDGDPVLDADAFEADEAIGWLHAATPADVCGVELRILPDSPQAGGPGPTDDLGAFGGPDSDPDWAKDPDHDGVRWRYDCAPDDPTRGAGLGESCNDRDDDCDGDVDEDLPTFVADYDRDGFWADGSTPTCYPQQGWVPADQVRPGDCDDARATVHPGADEPPNGEVDFDCDGTTSSVGLIGGGCDQTGGGGWMSLFVLGLARRIGKSAREQAEPRS